MLEAKRERLSNLISIMKTEEETTNKITIKSNYKSFKDYK
jgi:hypothetical protein